MKILKTKKFYKSILSLILALTMVFGCSTMFAGCSDTDDTTLENAKDLLQGIVADQMDSWVDKLGDAFNNAGKNELPALESTRVNFTVTVGDIVINALEESFAQNSGSEMDFSFLSSISMDMEMDLAEEMDKLQLAIGLNGEQIITLNVLMNMAEFLFYAGSPELDDTYIKFDGSSMMGNVNMPMNPGSMMNPETINALIQALPDAETLGKILDRYTGIIFGSINNVEQSNTTLEVAGVSQNCTQYLLSIYEADAINIIKSVLTTAKTDADLKVVVEDMVGLIETMTGQTIGANVAYLLFQQYIDVFLQQFANMQATDTTNPIKIYTYFAGDEMVGIKVSTPEVENIAYSYSVKNGDTAAFICSAMDMVEFSGKTTTTNGVTNGKIAYSIQGNACVEIILEDMTEASGTVTIKPTDYLLGLFLGSALPFSDLALQFKLGETMEMNILTGSDLIVGFSAKVVPTEGLDFGIPSDTVDATNNNALTEWAGGLNPEQILENLRTAGAGEFVDLLEQLLSQDGAMGEASPV